MRELPSIGLKKLALCASILFASMFVHGSSVEWDRMDAVDAKLRRLALSLSPGNADYELSIIDLSNYPTLLRTK